MVKEIKGQKNFEEYLNGISTEGNPSPCPDLRVLPEDVNFSDGIIGERDYRKGTLICKNSSEIKGYALLNHNCSISGNVYSDKGKLFVKCNSYKRKTLEMEIKEAHLI